jgi:hypothetical protein
MFDQDVRTDLPDLAYKFLVIDHFHISSVYSKTKELAVNYQ